MDKPSVPVRVDYTIERPLTEVREAIVDPRHMTQYFITNSSGRMETGAQLVWEWRDVGAKCDVHVHEVTDDKIAFRWAAGGEGTQVTLSLEAAGNTTKLVATEGPFEMSEQGVALALQQTQGWTDFCCSLRAYLHHGVNLRKNKPAD